VTDRREHADVDAPVLAAVERAIDVVRATVHGDGVAARGEARAELFREGLETAVIRRDAARTQNRDPHDGANRDQPQRRPRTSSRSARRT
jgi:hypothetical protein